MLREEADLEADRRNREDPDRERFEFYAFDESAGMAPDAWDVAARLRQGPRTDRPATAAGARRAAAAAAPATVPQETVLYETVAPAESFGPEPAYGETAYHEAPVEYAPETQYAPETEYAPADQALPEYDERHGLPEEPEPAPAEDRPGLFVRLVGAVVVVVGLLWIGVVVALALFLKPEDATSFAVYIAGAVLGLLAIALGVAIRRS